MNWVLIIALWGYGNQQPAVTTAQFETKELCLKAVSEVGIVLSLSARDADRVKLACVKVKN